MARKHGTEEGQAGSHLPLHVLFQLSQGAKVAGPNLRYNFWKVRRPLQRIGAGYAIDRSDVTIEMNVGEEVFRTPLISRRLDNAPGYHTRLVRLRGDNWAVGGSAGRSCRRFRVIPFGGRGFVLQVIGQDAQGRRVRVRRQHLRLIKDDPLSEHWRIQREGLVLAALAADVEVVKLMQALEMPSESPQALAKVLLGFQANRCCLDQHSINTGVDNGVKHFILLSLPQKTERDEAQTRADALDTRALVRR
eukprot:scaffold3307_cov265-Pinguiococcus_pyrenoidosus.AAC.21